MGCTLLGGWVCEHRDFIRVHAVRVHQTEVSGKRGGLSVGSHQEHSSYGWSFRVRFVFVLTLSPPKTGNHSTHVFFFVCDVFN